MSTTIAVDLTPAQADIIGKLKENSELRIRVFDANAFLYNIAKEVEPDKRSITIDFLDAMTLFQKNLITYDASVTGDKQSKPDAAIYAFFELNF